MIFVIHNFSFACSEEISVAFKSKFARTIRHYYSLKKNNKIISEDPYLTVEACSHVAFVDEKAVLPQLHKKITSVSFSHGCDRIVNINTRSGLP